MWVEQPVGVGFTQGVPDISDEIGLTKEFMGFFKNFIDAFGMHGWDIYLTGESYAGYYVPYIADGFVNASDSTYFNLKGVAINDPIIGDSTNQQETVIVAYADYWQKLMYLNETFMNTMREEAAACGYTTYLEKYLTFPPPGPLPLLSDPFASPNYTCDV